MAVFCRELAGDRGRATGPRPTRRRPMTCAAVGLLITLLLPAGGSGVLPQDGDASLDARLLRTWTTDDLTMVDGLANVPLAMLAGSATGSYRFELTVFDDEDNQLFRDGWERTLSDRAAAFIEADAAFLFESFRFGVRPGVYAVEIAAYPIDAPDLGSRVRLPLTAFAERPTASDLFLADRVEPIAEGAGGGSWSITHGGFGIGAAARTVVLPDEPDLYYYLELYAAEGRAGPMQVAAAIVDRGRTVYRTPPAETDVPAGGAPFTGSLSVAGLPPGEYELSMSIQTGDGESIQRAAGFRVLDPEAAVAVTGDEGSLELDYFMSLSEAELDATFGGVAVLVTESERRVFEDLPPDARRRYLVQFFRERDPDPAVPGNFFLDEYLERVGTIRARYNERVGTGERPPWLTDRGKLYLKLGEPQDRVVNYNPSDLGSPTSVLGAGGFGGEPPYEIWQYHSTGFVYLFVQENRFDAWRMIYTSDPDMTSLVDWRSRIGPEAVQDLERNFGIRARF